MNSSSARVVDNFEQGSPSVHGGDIVSASAHYNIAQEHWLDLSTGLNPRSYPSANVPASAYAQLPYLQPAFISSAKRYYGSADMIPLIGSQMLIQALPGMLQLKPVLLPDVGYREHWDSWHSAGFSCSSYPAFNLSQMIDTIDSALAIDSARHLVVINPNNPSGLLLEPEQLIRWANALGQDCYMVVDEAFIDLTPECSVLAMDWPANMIVLRSFGKFFGLAGIRIGFAFAQGELAEKISVKLGLWMINGPAQYIGEKALADVLWQQQARNELAADAEYTQQLFAPLIDDLVKIEIVEKQCDSNLFSSVEMPLERALSVQQHFCRAGILLRVINLKEHASKQHRALLRIGVLARDNTVHSEKVKTCITQYINQRPQHNVANENKTRQKSAK